jgi:hypothetical protein
VTAGNVLKLLISFVAYEWSQQASKLFQSRVILHYSLLRPFISYEEKKRVVTAGNVLKLFISFVTYEWSQQASKLFQSRVILHYSLLCKFISYEEKNEL